MCAVCLGERPQTAEWAARRARWQDGTVYRKVIAEMRSGGQTGVDIAALRAARACGIPTGGIMPKGFRTLDGPHPDWAREFSLTEHASSEYAPRTFQNVRDADITVQIAADFTSSGERCTARAVRQYGRHPPVEVQLRRRDGRWCVSNADMSNVAQLIISLSAAMSRPVIVNFAGNSERTAPGIELAAEGIVRTIIQRCAT
jgi:hypothetical protein